MGQLLAGGARANLTMGRECEEDLSQTGAPPYRFSADVLSRHPTPLILEASWDSKPKMRLASNASSEENKSYYIHVGCAPNGRIRENLRRRRHLIGQDVNRGSVADGMGARNPSFRELEWPVRERLVDREVGHSGRNRFALHNCANPGRVSCKPKRREIRNVKLD